jgi:iron complex transport system substrate-binding protein
MKKLILSLIIILFFTVGCSQTIKNNSNKVQIKDALGREVMVNSKVEKVIAVGPGALRLYLTIDDINKIIGVEQIEIDSSTGRPYNISNPELQDIEIIGLGGPNNQPDAEKLIKMNPDVIFSMYSTDISDVDRLQDRINVPVVALSYGTVPPFDESIYRSLEIIGNVMDKNKRSLEVIEFLKNSEKDLNDRTAYVADKPKVYIGALSSKGIHGIESTAGEYSLLKSVNAYNVVDETGKSGSLMIDKEKLIQWNPEKIIIDMAGNIDAFKNGEIYMQLPFNYYNTNIGTAVANAYFIGKSIYPESFKDINPEGKADEIYSFLYGKKVYSVMADDFGKFDKLRLR